MRNAPFFSVVIPAYEMHGRGAEFLDFSFAILEQQTWRDFEIVLSDHSAGTDVERLCTKWRGRLDLRYCRFEEKHGNSSANLNNAIAHARGTWIKILFQDDFLLGDRVLETMHRHLAQHVSAMWLAVGCDHTTDGTTLTRQFRPRWNDAMVAGRNTLSSPSVIAFHRDVPERFDESLLWLMDVDFYQRMFLRYGEPAYVMKSLVVNRLWGHRLSDTISSEAKTQEHAVVNRRYPRRTGLRDFGKKLAAKIGFACDERRNLENAGERMDIDYYDMPLERMDIYQKSHFMRYRFARELMRSGDVVADMACGSGYGTMLLAEQCSEAHGYDIDRGTIAAVKRRYAGRASVHFHREDLLQVSAQAQFDQIVSFETIEHIPPEHLDAIFAMFHCALKPGGRLIFSTPYNQEDSPATRRFHRTFHITEARLGALLRGKFVTEKFLYQNYDSHELVDSLETKHFIVCLARREDGTAPRLAHQSDLLPWFRRWISPRT
jgi:2-polyprenyl-3-methyl-5-hydroxy-6-metoxy-1,4-benzoquinol methylase